MSMMQLSCVFTFAASHYLTKYHGKCEHLHGHNYKLIITIEDKMKDDGMVMDFKIIKDIVKVNVIDILDHRHLNDIIENPSAEHLSVWIWQHLKDHLPLKKVVVYETDNYFCEYDGR